MFLTGYPDVPTTVRAIKAGAEDFLIKPVSSEDLLAAVERAMAHHQAGAWPGRTDSIYARACCGLDAARTQVFQLIIRGKTNKQAANALGATERTIKAHRQTVMEKMQVPSLAELVSLAERIGVLDATSETRQTNLENFL